MISNWIKRFGLDVFLQKYFSALRVRELTLMYDMSANTYKALLLQSSRRMILWFSCDSMDDQSRVWWHAILSYGSCRRVNTAREPCSRPHGFPGISPGSTIPWREGGCEIRARSYVVVQSSWTTRPFYSPLPLVMSCAKPSLTACLPATRLTWYNASLFQI